MFERIKKERVEYRFEKLRQEKKQKINLEVNAQIEFFPGYAN